MRALSDNVEAFLKGFAHPQRLMRNLHVNKLMIWPRCAILVCCSGHADMEMYFLLIVHRFHASIAACFQAHAADTVELGIRLTDVCI